MLTKNKPFVTLREICVFPMLAAVMFCSKILMEAFPNIHLLGMFTMAYTVAFGGKALIIIYLYVVANGFFSGFALWWYPYLYVWTILWGATMFIPKKLSKKVKCILYPTICCMHGLLFGVLYAPSQALMFGFDFKQTIAWIVAGFPFDIIHGISNAFAGLLVFPISSLLIKITKK